MRQRSSDSTDKSRASKGSNGTRIFFVAVVVVMAVALMVGNPYSEAWFLKCPLHSLTGLQCPLCGAQRQLHSLMHLDIAEAWRMNAGLLFCYPYMAFMAACQFSVKLRESHAGRIANADKTIFIFVGVLLLWGVIRNMFGI